MNVQSSSLCLQGILFASWHHKSFWSRLFCSFTRWTASRWKTRAFCIWTDSPTFGNYMNSLVMGYVWDTKVMIKTKCSLHISACCQTTRYSTQVGKLKNWEKIIGKICRVFLAWLLHASTLSIGLSQKTLNIQRVLSDL